MIVIDDVCLAGLSNEARNSTRLRKNYNYHELLSDPINRMLNAIEPGSYVQPHKHENPDKREAFIILKGQVVVFFFDDEGEMINHVLLSRDSGRFGVEIKPGQWHSLASLESGSVVYEVKDGPYIPISDKNMAPWAPKEGDKDAPDYLAGLLRKAGC